MRMSRKSRLIAVSGAFVGLVFSAFGIAVAATNSDRPPAPIGSLPPLNDRPGVTLDPSLRQQLDDAQRSGWTRVSVGPQQDGFVRTDEITPRDPRHLPKYGQKLIVVDSNGQKIGYWINPLGYVDAATADAPGFSWREYLRREKPQTAEEILQAARTQDTLP